MYLHVHKSAHRITQGHHARPAPLVQLHPRPGSNGEATEDHLCGARAPGGSGAGDFRGWRAEQSWMV